MVQTGYLKDLNLEGTIYKLGPVLYGTCETGETTGEKAVVCPDYNPLSPGEDRTGTIIAVKFTHSNTSGFPSLNVNRTGAMPIYKYGSIPISSTDKPWTDGAYVTFMNIGVAWSLLDYSMESPIFHGAPQAPTAAVGTNNTQIATTEFVNATLNNLSPKYLQVDVPITASTEPTTIGTLTDSSITADMVVVNSWLATPSNQTSDWTVTTANGSVTVVGTCVAADTLTLILAETTPTLDPPSPDTPYGVEVIRLI